MTVAICNINIGHRWDLISLRKVAFQSSGAARYNIKHKRLARSMASLAPWLRRLHLAILSNTIGRYMRSCGHKLASIWMRKQLSRWAMAVSKSSKMNFRTKWFHRTLMSSTSNRTRRCPISWSNFYQTEVEFPHQTTSTQIIIIITTTNKLGKDQMILHK